MDVGEKNEEVNKTKEVLIIIFIDITKWIEAKDDEVARVHSNSID